MRLRVVGAAKAIVELMAVAYPSREGPGLAGQVCPIRLAGRLRAPSVRVTKSSRRRLMKVFAAFGATAGLAWRPVAAVVGRRVVGFLVPSWRLVWQRNRQDFEAYWWA